MQEDCIEYISCFREFFSVPRLCPRYGLSRARITIASVSSYDSRISTRRRVRHCGG